MYLYLLKMGARPASRVAHGVGLKRGHTYNVLLGLISRGLVTEYLQGKVKYFLAGNPESLLNAIDQEISEKKQLRETVQRHISAFPEVGTFSANKSDIRYFNGIDGVKLVYRETLRQNGHEIRAFADYDYIFLGEESPTLNSWMWRYCDDRARKRITYLGIVNRSVASDLAYRFREKHRRQLKLIDRAPLPAEILVYDDSVAIISLRKDPMALLIQNTAVASAVRALHQTFWDLLPDYSTKS